VSVRGLGGITEDERADDFPYDQCLLIRKMQFTQNILDPDKKIHTGGFGAGRREGEEIFYGFCHGLMCLRIELSQKVVIVAKWY